MENESERIRELESVIKDAISDLRYAVKVGVLDDHFALNVAKDLSSVLATIFP